MSPDELHAQLIELDPEAARTIDMKNRRRVIRALEICLLTGKPASEVVAEASDSLGKAATTVGARGYRCFRFSRPGRALCSN